MPAFADTPSESSGVLAGRGGGSDGREVEEIVETQTLSIADGTDASMAEGLGYNGGNAQIRLGLGNRF